MAVTPLDDILILYPAIRFELLSHKYHLVPGLKTASCYFNAAKLRSNKDELSNSLYTYKKPVKNGVWIEIPIVLVPQLMS
jgi:hypothetical protein